MTQTKHTPGPWKALEFDRVYADSKFVALVYPCTEAGHSTPESTANAHLIAAAPDMLEALIRCLNFIENTEGEHGLVLACGDVARAAIAKATGVQP